MTHAARLRAGLLLGLLSGGVALLYLLDPAKEALFPPCPFHWATGLKCPGCGSLRAVHAFLNGDVVAALTLNPVAVAFFPLLLWCTADWITTLLLGRRLPHFRITRGFGLAVAAAFVFYTVVRNL